MERELRIQALASLEKCMREVQVVIIVLTRQLAHKVAEQLNEDAGEEVCLPCINDRRFEEHLNELINHKYPIVAGTLGRIDILFYRNALRLAFIKEVYILDSAAMVHYPLKRSLERLLGYIQQHIRVTLHMPPSTSVVSQIRNFLRNVFCYESYAGLLEANHFAIHVMDEMRKIDAICELCQMNTSAPILLCCSSQGTAFANAKILRGKNLPVVTMTRQLKSEDVRIAIDAFLSGRVNIMITTGYVRGLIDLKTPMIIINCDIPKPDAYARRVIFTGESWVARNTVFITLVKMNERWKLRYLKEKLGLRWILETYSN